MSFFLIIWRMLWRRRARSVLTAAGVAIGVAAGVAMAGISWGFQRSLERTYAARGADMVVSRLTNRRPFPTPFEQSRAKDIAAMPGVSAVAGMVWDMLSLEESPTMIVYGWEPGSFLWEHLTPRSGRFAADTNDGDCVYLGTLSAEVLKKRVGDTIRVESRNLRVAAIFESTAMVENGAVILPLPTLQAILGSEGKVNFLNVRLESSVTEEQYEKLRQTIQARFRGLKVFRAGEMGQNSIGIQSAKAMSLATLILALVVGTLGVMNTMLMNVFERTSEIGLLMAVGWARSRILGLILLESVVLSLLGAVVGVISGIVGARLLQWIPFMQDKIEPDFSASLVLAALAMAVVLGVLGGAYPAWRAASLQPQEALRAE